MGGMDDVSTEEAWELAYLALYHDAMVGRCFTGLVHNMNGVLQAFSMQSELLGMMFGQAEGMVEAILSHFPDGEGREQAEKLRDLLLRRSEGVAMLEEKIRQGQEIMASAMGLPDIFPAAGDGDTLNSVLSTEMEFLCGDRFFKHTVRKEISLAEGLPPLSRHLGELHRAVFALLQNSLDALRDCPEPLVSVKTFADNGMLKVSVANNGPEIMPEDLERIFDRFFTTRKEHAGLGLYLARKMMARCGGDVQCVESVPGRTCFVLSVPVAEVGAGE